MVVPKISNTYVQTRNDNNVFYGIVVGLLFPAIIHKSDLFL